MSTMLATRNPIKIPAGSTFNPVIPCEQSSQCEGFGAACLTSVDGNNGPVTIPNGYCTHACILACGSNEKCVSTSGGSGKICVRSCEENSDCRAAEGYECADKECTLPGL